MTARGAITVEYNIQVKENGDATVTQTPPSAKLQVDDSIIISSNDARTVIQYRGTSPVAEISKTDDFPIGKGKKGPFKCVLVGKSHHFDCGFMLGGHFQKWGDTDGASTPVGPKGN